LFCPYGQPSQTKANNAMVNQLIIDSLQNLQGNGEKENRVNKKYAG